MGRIREMEARQSRRACPRLVRWAHRIARDAASQAVTLRDLEHRPGDFAQSGRQEYARAYLREPRTVCARGHAGIARQNPRARGMEAEGAGRSEEHTSELQSHVNLVCRLLLEKKKSR